MFTAYVRLEQDGIEELDKYDPPEKAKEGGHWFFNDFRISLQYYFSNLDRTSGVGILAFAPNGNIWCQTAVYCDQLDELVSYYYAIARALEEAEKSKAKFVEIYIPNKKVATIINEENPFKEKILADVHTHVIDQFKKFSRVIITFRKDYSKDVQSRLDIEARNGSTPPEISLHGHVSGKINLMYFNVIMPEEEKKQWAEQYARICLNFMDNYMKEYEQDYGKEALTELHKKMKEKEIKDLPPTKRNLRENRESVPIKVKIVPFKKVILCQNCESVMTLESATLEKPEDEKHFKMRCKKCYATKTVNEMGRTLQYGRYPKKTS